MKKGDYCLESGHIWHIAILWSMIGAYANLPMTMCTHASIACTLAKERGMAHINSHRTEDAQDY